MNDGVKETKCTHCFHKDVCMYKQDFIDICNAVFDATVAKEDTDGKTCMKKVTNYDCLGNIEVNCRHYKQEVANTKEGIF